MNSKEFLFWMKGIMDYNEELAPSLAVWKKIVKELSEVKDTSFASELKPVVYPPLPVISSTC